MTWFHIESINYPSTEGTPLHMYGLLLSGCVIRKNNISPNIKNDFPTVLGQRPSLLETPFGEKLLERSIGSDFGALKRVKEGAPSCHSESTFR